MENSTSIIADALLTVFYTLCALSTICVVAHLFKFYKTNSPQSLPTKNLTFYCFILLLIYITEFVYILLTKSHFQDLAYHPYVILLYLMVTTTVVKLIIAIDLCHCFRKMSLYLQRPSSSTQNKKFIVYSLLGTCTPMFYILIWFVFSKRGQQTTSFEPCMIMRIIRITRLVLVCVAFWYLRNASINKKELWSKYGLHMRLLVMLGGFSAIVSIAEVILINFQPGDKSGNGDNADEMEYWFYFVHVFGNILEGIFIAIFFTFRKNTFKFSHTSSPQTSIDNL